MFYPLKNVTHVHKFKSTSDSYIDNLIKSLIDSVVFYAQLYATIISLNNLYQGITFRA